MTAIERQHKLQALEAERALAWIEGLSGNLTYMDDLRAEIDATRNAYVATAVTEIASLRAELSGAQFG